ncbi:hypothetical protein [Ensifer sp. Root558]|uniref:hypothetical protein n=1 Tax=Ensifer sp. Root558 TaxID=1736558 RepID=UPI00071619B2|nr:hypothetical protein [Ensifer sp. Root558]KQZ47449.1 hypothetical protein ASD63_31890 [Ensifer sp. Root558]
MNFKRGLFRMWVVLSGLWALLVGAFSYDSVVSPYFSPRAFYFLKNVTPAAAKAELDKRRSVSSSSWSNYEIRTPEGFVYTMQGVSSKDAYDRLTVGLGTSIYELKPVTVELYTEKYRQLEEGERNGHTQQVEIIGLPEVTLFAAKDASAEELKRQAAEAYRVGIGVKKLVTGMKRKGAIMQAALWGILPPLALFLFGWILLWIGRGFKSSN